MKNELYRIACMDKPAFLALMRRHGYPGVPSGKAGSFIADVDAFLTLHSPMATNLPAEILKEMVRKAKTLAELPLLEGDCPDVLIGSFSSFFTMPILLQERHACLRPRNPDREEPGRRRVQAARQGRRLPVLRLQSGSGHPTRRCDGGPDWYVSGFCRRASVAGVASAKESMERRADGDLRATAWAYRLFRRCEQRVHPAHHSHG